MRAILKAAALSLALIASSQFCAAEITSVSAAQSQVTIHGNVRDGTAGVAELQPYQSSNDLSSSAETFLTKAGRDFTIKIPRWDGPRDRLYSGFVAFKKINDHRVPLGAIHFVESIRGVSRYDDSFPRVASKKGLQVQMVDDAIALGVKHAGLNVNLAAMIDLSNAPDSSSWISDGITYHFRKSFTDGLDQQVPPLSRAGMVVTLILLNYENPDPAINRITLHPNYSPNAPNHLSAFSTLTPEGCRYFKACVEFLADRYSSPPYAHGRAVNFIVGNEVNAHWQWANLGEASMEKFADDYLRTVRLCNTAVRKYSSSARVYICLEHHWNISNESASKSFPGREFIDYLNQRANAGGNFDWNLAFHPYPEDLTEPRTWNDKTATRSDDTPRITFKNLELLPRYFNRPELLYHGKQRHIILSEQGFNTPNNPDGELWQAAGFCYAYYKIARLPGIDSFILHRQVDHRDEGGLHLGLWRRNEASASPAEPSSKKKVYEVFRAADTPQWHEAFEFALRVIGIQRWEDLPVNPPGEPGKK